GLQRNVLLHVAAVEQLVEFYVNDRLLPVYHAHHARAVAGCELTEPTDLKHRIEYRHSLAIGQRLRVHHLTDYLHQTEGPRGGGDDDVDLGRANVLAQHLLHVAGELRRSLADRDHVLYQRSGDLAVGAHRHGHRQLGVAPHEHLQRVTRTDDVVVVGGLRGGCVGMTRGGRSGWRGRGRGAPSANGK